MKKRLFILFFVIVITCFLVAGNCNAGSYSTFEIDLEVVENSENKTFDMYILLPKEYILYAIENSNLEIEYNGADTLKQNTIPGIIVDKENILDDVYVDDGVEYVQILLEPINSTEYTFNILSEYGKMDMKFRIKNDERDYILYLDNFKIDNSTCKVKYDYDNNEIRQDGKLIIKLGAILIAIAIILVVLIITAKRKRG